MGKISYKKELIIYCFTLLMTALLFGNNILLYQGKKAALIMAVIVTVIDVLSAILAKKYISIVNQLSAGLFVFFAYVLVSVLFNNAMWDYESRFSKGLIVFFTVYSFIVIESLIAFVRTYNKEKLVSWFKDNRVMLVVLLIVLVSRIPSMTLSQRWDAGEYYYRIGLARNNFTYSGLADFFHSYSLCGHSASLFCMTYMIGEMIYPRHIIGISVINLILTLIAMWCIYKIIVKITRYASKSLCAVYTLLISFAPLVYTFTTHLNLDYTMALIVVMIICSYMYEKPVLVGILSILCFQTKENGLVVVAGIALGQIVRHILCGKKNCIKPIFTDLRLYATLIAALLQLRYFNKYGNNWVATGDQEAGGLFKWNNHGSECLGLNPYYIWMKFRQQFILNFNWIVVLIIIAGTIYIIKNKEYLKKLGHKRSESFMICSVVGSLVTHSMFAYLYITGTCTRYNIISDILMYIIAIYVIDRFREVYGYKQSVTGDNTAKAGNSTVRKYAGKVLLGIWIVLVAAECFVTIDPLSKLVFTNADSVTMDTLIMTREHELMTYGESLIHNTQYQSYDKSMDKMLKDIDYDPDTTDIYLYDDGGVFICGNVPLYYLSWDKTKQKRVFYQNENTKQMNDYYLIFDLDEKGDELLKNGELKEKAVFVVTTYYVNKSVNVDFSMDVLSRYYDISERKTASTYQGGIYYYELTLKK